MMRLACIVAAAALVALAAGCAAREERVVEVDCRMAGASAETMTSSVAWPLMCAMAAHVDGFRGMRAVSGDGESRLYVSVIGRASGMEAQAGKAVAEARDKLPSGALVAAVTVLPAGTKVPTVAVRTVPRLTIVIDRQRAAALGISMEAINDALVKVRPPNAAGRENPAELAKVMVRGQEGMVRLADIATFETKMEPDHVVRDWP